MELFGCSGNGSRQSCLARKPSQRTTPLPEMAHDAMNVKSTTWRVGPLASGSRLADELNRPVDGPRLLRAFVQLIQGATVMGKQLKVKRAFGCKGYNSLLINLPKQATRRKVELICEEALVWDLVCMPEKQKDGEKFIPGDRRARGNDNNGEPRRSTIEREAEGLFGSLVGTAFLMDAKKGEVTTYTYGPDTQSLKVSLRSISMYSVPRRRGRSR